MPNIRIDSTIPISNGQALTFKSPADCSQVTGLIVYYPEGDTTTSKEFKFVDAHGVDMGSGTVSLFAENVLVKVILDTDARKAYVQNADTNAYLEGRFADIFGQLSDKSASKIETGSYTGTGDLYPSLTFSFEPKFLYISATDENKNFVNSEIQSFCRSIIAIRGQSYAYMLYMHKNGNEYVTLKCEIFRIFWENNTVYWRDVGYYNWTTGGTHNLNATGEKYNYIAIG